MNTSEFGEIMKDEFENLNKNFKVRHSRLDSVILKQLKIKFILRLGNVLQLNKMLFYHSAKKFAVCFSFEVR